jgi:transcriptional regulator with XRE-family HTH domain
VVAERSGPSPPFAELLRDFRLLAGLTQEELAERAGLSPRGVSDLERGARRNPYPATVRQLAAAMSLAPEDQASLEAAAQGRRGPARRETAAEGVSSPLTSFVGRQRERADVQALLARNRLITLTGIRGIGKTRLALAVADHAVPTLAEQALLVELAALSDPQLVPRVLTQPTGCAPRSQRAAHRQPGGGVGRCPAAAGAGQLRARPERVRGRSARVTRRLSARAHPGHQPRAAGPAQGDALAGAAAADP